MTLQEMPISITVKNTFLTLSRQVEEPVRRSSSVPRTFKPGVFADCAHSDDSTDASEKDASRKESSEADSQDFPDWRSDCTDDEFANPYQDICWDCSSADARSDDGNKSRVTLSLADMVAAEGTEKARCKLKATARPFMSARSPPADVTAVIASAVEVLSCGDDIYDVKVQDGGMGGTTMILAKSSSPDPDPLWIFSLVKDALLNSAEQSENTYILGYGEQPFKNLDQLSFGASIGCVPAAHQDTCCWDFYEKGCCPRFATCRWNHPAETDMMRIIVMIKRGA